MTSNFKNDTLPGQAIPREARSTARSEAARKAANTSRARKASRDAGASRVVGEPITNADQG